ncbi:recombinase RecT [Micromonospora sp. STR1s_5]|nr:recombinase RecT [Micromonospora sp. STR1s_5]
MDAATQTIDPPAQAEQQPEPAQHVVEGDVEHPPAAEEQAAADSTPAAGTELEPAQHDVIKYDPDTKDILVPTPIPGMHLVFHQGQRTLTPEQMRLLAPLRIKAEWDPDQVLVFLLDCNRRGFDPWAKEAYLMQYKTRDGLTYINHIGIGGFRRTGEESGQYRGRTPIEWCGSDGVWKEVWLDGNTAPAAARVGIIREGFERPLYGVATYDEFAPMVDKWVGGEWDPQEGRKIGGKKDGQEPVPMWRPGKQGGKASLMLAKCAEAQAWRAAFPTRFNGFYAPEELDKLRHEGAAAHSAAAQQSTAERRQAAYRDAMTIDGTAVDVTNLRQQLAAPDARHKLFAELGAQAQILGMSHPRKLVEKWEAARGGKRFEQATNMEVAMHVHRYREYVIGKLREQGETDRADRYAKAPAVGDLVELFGEQPHDDTDDGTEGRCTGCGEEVPTAQLNPDGHCGDCAATAAEDRQAAGVGA